MIDRYVEFAHNVVRRHRKTVLWLTLLLLIAAGAVSLFSKFEGNIDLMLPDDPEIRRSMAFLKDSNLSEKIIVSLTLTSQEKSKKDLFNAIDRLAASLNPPLFTKVSAGFSMQDALGDVSFINYAPQILGEKDLLAIDTQITGPGIAEKMRTIYRQSLRPESVFTLSAARSDPMGINMLLLNKLKTLTASMGYNVALEDGHFISRDGRHAMMVIQTPVSMTDGPGCKKLIQALNERIRLLPDYVSADIVSGHLHTLSNEKVLKRDIQLASVIASLAFLVLFIAVFRDVRVIPVFIIPMLAVVLAIALSNVFVGRLSYLVIGLGTVIAGISIDYGIHVYIAFRKGADLPQTVKLSKLLFIDAVTTVFGFFTLSFSEIQGYHQLAFFSILCIVFSLILALFILPLVLSRKGDFAVSLQHSDNGHKRGLWHRKSHVFVWVLLSAALLFFSFGVKVDSDITRLDGSEPEIIRAEENFHAAWGGEAKQAIFVVTGKDYEKTMEANDRIYQEAALNIDVRQISSFAMLWHAEKTRRENVERWNNFWRGEREQKLKKLIREQSGRYQLSENAFAPFFSNLYNNPLNPTLLRGKEGVVDGIPEGLFTRFKERFVQKKNDEYRIISFFPDEKEYLEPLSAISKRYPDTFIVSRKALSQSISDTIVHEVKFLAALAVIFNIILTFLFFRSIRETLIALVPVVTSLIWLFGLMSLSGLTLNVVNVIAAIIVTGLVVDFGIGMTYEYRYDLNIGTVAAVTLSAATTFIGAGALVFAGHPALFPIGVSMLISVMSGYLSSVFVVPCLCDMFLTHGSRNP